MKKAQNEVTSNLPTKTSFTEKYVRLIRRNIMLGPGNKSNWHPSSSGSSYKGLNTNHLNRCYKKAPFISGNILLWWLSKIHKKRYGIPSCLFFTVLYTANNFPFMGSQKRFSQVLLVISTKYFQNRIIMFSLELWYYVQCYRCSH